MEMLELALPYSQLRLFFTMAAAGTRLCALPSPRQAQWETLRLPRIRDERKAAHPATDERPFLWSTALTLMLTYAASSPCALAIARHRFRADSRYWRRNPHVMYSAAPRVPANRKGTRYRAVNASTL